MPWPCLALSVTLAVAVVNEILYDPPGPDGGKEFVELFNAGEAPVALDAARLVFVNGSAPEEGEVVWSGEPGLVLAPGAFFVLGGEQVEARDRTVALGLQNGDEAVQLWIAGAMVDAVAWGTVDLALGEGAPAGPGPGQALGRVPDGRDTGGNARDFRPLPVPTPGRANLAAEQFTLVSWVADPVWREDAGAIDLALELVATGWAELQRGELIVAGESLPVSVAAADTVRFRAPLDVVPGAVEVEVRVQTAASGPELLTTLPLRCGVAELVLTEVQPRPLDGEPEWFELQNRGAAAVRLDGWAIRDRAGRARALVERDSLAPGERLVVTADAQQLLDFYPALTARTVVPAGGWPTLNDSAPAGETAADSLQLLDRGGAVVDLVTWSGEDIGERGRPLQRGALQVGRASLWLPAAAGATPGAPAADETRSWPTGGLACVPDPFTPDGDGTGDELEVLLVGPFSNATVRVFDLRGDLVRQLSVVGAVDRSVARWDGRDGAGRPVPSGAYVVVVETTDGGAPASRLRRVVGLGRAE